MAAKEFAIGGLLLAVCIQGILAASFDYSSSSGKGPNKWAEKFPNYCNGSSQSPVDIVVSKAKYENLGAITFTGYTTKKTMDVANNGHSLAVTVAPNTFSISGGGLSGTYSLASFHLHWGSKDTQGSEHTVDGKKYPAELHLVHMNNKYGNLSEALKKSDGLAVLGVLLKVGSENAALQSFLKYTVNVTKPNTKVTGLTQTHALNDLLPVNTSHFYRYSGGLTTPNCNEVVTWTVFKNAATISTAQLALLRGLKETNSTMIVDNYRPVQLLNSRVIKTTYKVDVEATTEAPTFGRANHVTNHLAIVMALMAVVFKIVL